jgi:hypothetical protein
MGQTLSVEQALPVFGNRRNVMCGAPAEKLIVGHSRNEELFDNNLLLQHERMQ